MFTLPGHLWLDRLLGGGFLPEQWERAYWWELGRPYVINGWLYSERPQYLQGGVRNLLEKNCRELSCIYLFLGAFPYWSSSTVRNLGPQLLWDHTVLNQFAIKLWNTLLPRFPLAFPHSAHTAKIAYFNDSNQLQIILQGNVKIWFAFVLVLSAVFQRTIICAKCSQCCAPM